MAQANANIEELHLHIKRPATSTNPKPTARCRVCKRQGLTKISYWICSQCPERPGLCSKRCFQDYHVGYEILLAARPLRTDTAPNDPQADQRVVQEHPGSSHSGDQLGEDGCGGDPEKLSADEWRKIQEREHVLMDKPPTKRKEKPRLACVECKYNNRRRNDVRTICSVCEPQRGLCSEKCLKENHYRTRVFQLPQPETSSVERRSLDQDELHNIDQPIRSSTPIQPPQPATSSDERRSPDQDQPHNIDQPVRSSTLVQNETHEFNVAPWWRIEVESSPERVCGPKTPPDEGPHEQPHPRYVPDPRKTPDLQYPSMNLWGKIISPNPPCQPSQEEIEIIRRVAWRMGEVRSPIKKDPAGGSKKRHREPEDPTSEPEDPTSDPSTSQAGTSGIMTRSRREKAKKKEDGQYAALDYPCSPLASSEEDK